MERNFFTKAIVLKTRRFGDYHKIVTMLSPQRGIIEAVAHGAYKGKSRISSCTDPFCVSNFLLYYNPAKENYKITECEPLEMNNKIRENLNAHYNASFYCEIILKTHASGAEYEFSYKLLKEILQELNKNTRLTVCITLHFLFRFLVNSGFIGQLWECGYCGKDITNEYYYSMSESCFLCSNCASSTSLKIKSEVFLYLRDSLSFNLEKSMKKRLDVDSELSIRNILLEVLQNIVDAPLNTLGFIDYGLE